MYMLASALQELCIEQDWFTKGSNLQYEKLFCMYGNGYSLKELAIAIWLCSEDVSVLEIYKILQKRLGDFER